MLWYPKRRSQKKILTSPFKQTFSLSLIDNLFLLAEHMETFQKDKKMDESQGDVNSTDTAILPSNPRRNTLKGKATDQSSPEDTSRELRRKPGLPDLERMTASRLRHQDSSATIKTNDQDSQSPESSTRTTGPGALRQERRKKSALLEQDVSRMRSESRLGARSTDNSFVSERDRTSSRDGSKTPLTQVKDGGDTSDTEGSGPVVGGRRRKKSSTSSSSKKAAATARSSQFRSAGTEVLPRHSVSPEDQFSSGKASRQSARRSSDANQNKYSSTVGRENTGRRTALPENFRAGSRAADNRDWTTTSAPTGPRRSFGTTESQHDWPRSTEANDKRNESLPSSNYRARRFASDADADDLPAARSSRISVDTSSVSRYLGRNPTPRTSSVAERAGDQADILYSPSEAARQRKVSASSTYSHRSSNGTSDLHRSASRASMRRAHGRDVFDDVPPMPELAGQTYSPRTVAAALDQRDKDERVRSLRERQNLMAEGGRTTSGLDDLRMRIDELTGTGANRSQSRASSRASRARSNMSSTPSTSVATTSATSVRPSTEPRKPNVYFDRAQIELSPESKRIGASLRQNQTSRLGVQPYHETVPRTPEITQQSVIRRATSRLSVSQSATTPANSNNRHNALNDPNGPLHARNLQSCIENLERQLLRPNSTDPASSDITREAVQLIERMREASTTSVEINNGLKTMIQAILGFQIDAELEGDGQDSIEAFAQVERGLGSIVRWSDDQMRSLTDGLMALSSMWNAHTRQILDVGDRSTDSIHARTRLAPRYTPKSPNKTNLLQEDRIQRRSSLDLRRLNSPNVRNTPWSNRRGTFDTTGGQNVTSPQLSPNGEASSANGMTSRNSNGSDHRSISDRSLRRFTASALPGEKASPGGSLSPFSSTDSVSTKQSSSRIRQANRPVAEGILRTPTYSNAHSQVEPSDAIHHSRTVSDVNPPSSAERANRDAFFPASLSPLKTRPSLARVTTVNASTHQKLHDSVADDLEDALESDLNGSSVSQDRIPHSEIIESPFQQFDTQRTARINGRPSISSRRLSRQTIPSFGDEEESASAQSASADTVLATPTSSANKTSKGLSNGSGLGLGLENVTSRIARSLGRNVGRRASQDVGTLTDNLRTTKIDNTRDDVD